MLLKIFKNKDKDYIEVVSPCEGRIRKLEESEDEVFATKTLGEGFFIRASESQVYAPLSGTVTSVFPTKHAIGFHTEHGMDMLIHIGVDTVKIKDDLIECTLVEGNMIKKMQPICELDLIAFRERGILPDVYVFITNSEEYHIEIVREDEDVYEGDIVLKCVRR